MITIDNLLLFSDIELWHTRSTELFFSLLLLIGWAIVGYLDICRFTHVFNVRKLKFASVVKVSYCTSSYIVYFTPSYLRNR